MLDTTGMNAIKCVSDMRLRLSPGRRCPSDGSIPTPGEVNVQ